MHAILSPSPEELIELIDDSPLPVLDGVTVRSRQGKFVLADITLQGVFALVQDSSVRYIHLG